MFGLEYLGVYANQHAQSIERDRERMLERNRYYASMGNQQNMNSLLGQIQQAAPITNPEPNPVLLLLE